MVNQQLKESLKKHPFALEEYDILRAGTKNEYEELTCLTAQICDAPIAVLYVLERNRTWVKSVFGISKDEVPAHFSFWLPVFENQEPLIVEDIRKNTLFKDFENPLNFSFYAGVPLITAEGFIVGVLYVLDYQPKMLSENKIGALKKMGHQIIQLLENKKQNKKLKEVQNKLQQKYKELEKFASVVSHDLKSPLANIISLTELLKEENKDLSQETMQYLDYLSQSSYSLRNYVDGILSFYRSDKLLEKEEENVELPGLLKNIANLFQVYSNVEITYPEKGVLQNVNKAALTQIFLNLISNSLKYNSKEVRKVDIFFMKTPSHYQFEVKDNGDGIPAEAFHKIFELFTTLEQSDRFGNTGSGIGLATVKKLLDHMEGSIEVESKLMEGSNFIFKIKRK